MTGRLSRRAFTGIPAILSLACRLPRRPLTTARDISYGSHVSQRLDVYAATRKPGRPAPVSMMVHGGGWIGGSRDDIAGFIPHLTSRGYVVANIGYRVASEALAPAAAEDVRNAIECVRSRCSEWGADSSRTLLIGFSAGAHLALLAALAPWDAITGPQSRACAIVSFWGITDVTDLLEGPHMRDFARQWVPEGQGQLELARRLSPLSYDAAEAPDLCAVHSVRDDVVPFSHSEKLVAKFAQAKRRARLIRLSHEGHAPPEKDYQAIFAEVFSFLDGNQMCSARASIRTNASERSSPGA
jgi:acetyl esterase/lipase